MKKLQFKRRREGKTDYNSRVKLLKSKEPRIVIRKTNKYIMAQIVMSKEARDFTTIYCNSKELAKFGWSFSFKNLPASYLTGFLTAQKAKKKNIKKAILDLGLQRSIPGSRIYAVVKGAVDNGLEINCKEEMFPKEERIKGNHTKKSDEIKKISDEIKNKIKSI